MSQTLADMLILVSTLLNTGYLLFIATVVQKGGMLPRPTTDALSVGSSADAARGSSTRRRSADRTHNITGTDHEWLRGHP